MSVPNAKPATGRAAGAHKAAPTPPAPADPNALRIEDDGKKSHPQLVAECSVTPSLHSASVLMSFPPLPGADLTELAGAVKANMASVQKGSTAVPEMMLMGQAEALQAIFTSLAKRAALNMGQYVDAADRYMRLALKAQSQCRATLETLAAIKNPSPVVIAKQANIANGPQQVNNGAEAAPTPAPAREIEYRPNKLLEHARCETLPTMAGPMNVDANKLPASANVNRGKIRQVREP